MFSNAKMFLKIGGISLTLFSICIFFLNSNAVYCLNRLKEGQKIESFSLNTLNGDKLDINKYLDGKNVGIIFWGIPEVDNYIDYSKEALKTLVKMYNEYKNNDLQIIAIYCPHEDEAVTEKEKGEIYKLVNELDISFPVLLDSELKVFDKFGVVAVPSFVLIDKSGIVKYILPGYPPYSAEKDIKKEIKYILNVDKMGS
ncbi:MAG: TlpA disulfide reductase family protein [bacterium]